MGHRERILEFLAQYPGRDDDEIAAALKIRPRQTVNQICRKLLDENLLRREPGERGKTVNFVIASSSGAAANVARSVPELSSDLMTEDQVKAALQTVLKSNGWSVKIAWGRQRGIDIEAERAGERWIIECKGEGSLAPMQNNYFVSVIGELMQRMSDPHAKHSIAFPDRPKFRRLWLELPTTVKERLQLSALFVSSEGTVVELST